MSPEDARDQAVEEIIAAGGSIISTMPMALPDSPHVISAYEINAGASDIDVLKALEKVKKTTITDLEGLVPYTPEQDHAHALEGVS